MHGMSLIIGLFHNNLSHIVRVSVIVESLLAYFSNENFSALYKVHRVEVGALVSLLYAYGFNSWTR